MTEAEVRARVVSFASAEVAPTLTAAELDMVVAMGKVVDIYKVWPSDPSWTPTWDVNCSIAQAWLIKAGKVANAYLYMTGGKMLSRNQMYDHCMKQYRLFAGKSTMKTIRLVPSSSRDVATQVPLASSD